MKLQHLHHQTDIDILRNYLKKLRNLCETFQRKKRQLVESKIVITIDDSKKDGLDIETKNSFIEKAKTLGEFNNPEWVDKLIRSMKQSGVQGFNDIRDDDKPVTNKQISHLIKLLMDLI